TVATTQRSEKLSRRPVGLPSAREKRGALPFSLSAVSSQIHEVQLDHLAEEGVDRLLTIGWGDVAILFEQAIPNLGYRSRLLNLLPDARGDLIQSVILT